jgi:hypothetical protein
MVTDFKNAKPSVVMSQSDIIRYIDSHWSSVQPASVQPSQTIEQLGVLQTHVVTMTTQETAMTGYIRMSQKKVLALPILDE